MWWRDRDSNPGRVLALAGFKTSAFNRSAIPPEDWYDTVFINKVNKFI